MSVISTWTALRVSVSLDLSESSVIDGLAMVLPVSTGLGEAMAVMAGAREDGPSWKRSRVRLPKIGSGAVGVDKSEGGLRYRVAHLKYHGLGNQFRQGTYLCAKLSVLSLSQSPLSPRRPLTALLILDETNAST